MTSLSPFNERTNCSSVETSRDLTKKLQYTQKMAFDEKEIIDMKNRLLAKDMRTISNNYR